MHESMMQAALSPPTTRPNPCFFSVWQCDSQAFITLNTIYLSVPSFARQHVRWPTCWIPRMGHIAPRNI